MNPNSKPFAKGSWQHAVDDALVEFGKTSEQFDTPHEAVAWLLGVQSEYAVAQGLCPVCHVGGGQHQRGCSNINGAAAHPVNDLHSVCLAGGRSEAAR